MAHCGKVKSSGLFIGDANRVDKILANIPAIKYNKEQTTAILEKFFDLIKRAHESGINGASDVVIEGATNVVKSSSNLKNSVRGAYHHLEYAFDVLKKEDIAAFEQVTQYSTRRYDIVMKSGKLIEMKNYTELDSQSIKYLLDQFKKDITKLPKSYFENPSNLKLEWVFRGDPKGKDELLKAMQKILNESSNEYLNALDIKKIVSFWSGKGVPF